MQPQVVNIITCATQSQDASHLADYGASHFYMITQACSHKSLRDLPAVVLRTIEIEKAQ